MQYKRKLRHRIAITFLAFTVLLSAVFTAAMFYLRSYTENQVIGVTLQRDLADYIRSVRDDPNKAEPSFNNIKGYVVSPGKLDIIPQEFHSLGSGIHNVDTDAAVFKVAVQKDADIWGYLIYEVSGDHGVQRQFYMLLLLSLIILVLVSWSLGFWSAKRVMAPVIDLARRLDTLGGKDTARSLTQFYAEDEVGLLAHALDDYSTRLTALVERDTEFNADVSHELRTPLAVISGASELLLSQEDLDARTRDRVLRIERAAKQSSALTTALLQLVRNQRTDLGPKGGHSVAKIIEQVVDSHRHQLGRKPVEVKVTIEQELFIEASDAVLTVAIGNLVGNAFKYTPAGCVSVTLSNGRLVVEDTGPGVNNEELPNLFARHYRGSSASGKGSGLGLAIVKRLCDLYGWGVSIQAQTGRGLKAELNFSVD